MFAAEPRDGPWAAAVGERRLRSACSALLVLSLSYSVAALFVPELPGWKMFVESSSSDSVVWDGAGRRIDVRRYLPRFAYGLSSRQIRRVAAFLCVSGRETPPIRFQASASSPRLELSPPTCGATVSPALHAAPDGLE
ncbi:MAG: hypothetical protein RL685_5542 [Pseudomonadota bacterium]|jgi:hypothetical protein